ncbi:MAG: aminomethyl-transferring glycine dehydrogenase subunit GcvPA [Gammaproteobacteria bacterium]|nr:aminomethyl-transferring glycine dehydrogenase subunit GcvPA [Gammaproteobacteria bacterium]
MPFIPHTETDVKQMLASIGVNDIEALFDEIPAELRIGLLDKVPAGLNEMEMSRLMHVRASGPQPLCFIGAGAYEHHIPAAIWEIVTRGEFYSAYTPYQAEASQGTLQLIYEYQTMMAHLTGMEASNASLYDGASGLAEAVLMAVRANRKSKSKRILMPASVNPTYRSVVQTIVENQGITLELVDYQLDAGCIDVASLPADPGDVAALVIPQPNFFGVLEDVNALTDWAHVHGLLVIAVVNPTSLALLTPPGEWGEQGADVVCGEGQPLGVPLAGGGPYFGFMCCNLKHVRQMPGRIVGRTVDADGKPGFALTLQAREQHIRRSKATSNICTNQGLVVAAATIYMTLLGAQGLNRVANSSHQNTQNLAAQLNAIDGVTMAFASPTFHEFVIKLDGVSAEDVLGALMADGVLGGFNLNADYPALGEAILVCATETKTAADIAAYRDALSRVMSRLKGGAA